MKFAFYTLIGILAINLATPAFSQNETIYDKIFGQDSSEVQANKLWVSFSYGWAFTTNVSANNIDLLILGTTLDFTYINSKYHLYKYKASFHHGMALFQNFAQYAADVNFMTGTIDKELNYTVEFYYGLGLIYGRKRTEKIDPYNVAEGRFMTSVFPTTHYLGKEFIFIDIPFEMKVQWRVAGFAFDGNINPYLPYLGAKLFFKIG